MTAVPDYGIAYAGRKAGGSIPGFLRLGVLVRVLARAVRSAQGTSVNPRSRSCTPTSPSFGWALGSEPSPGADVAGVNPVPVQMWHG